MSLFKLIIIGILAGISLAGMMHVIYLLTGSEAYQLLYNVDYIPGLQYFQQSTVFGFVFHFLFCIISVIVLYYLLKKVAPRTSPFSLFNRLYRWRGSLVFPECFN